MVAKDEQKILESSPRISNEATERNRMEKRKGKPWQATMPCKGCVPSPSPLQNHHGVKISDTSGAALRKQGMVEHAEKVSRI
eukprot:1832299-Amphidinium_carterae.1